MASEGKAELFCRVDFPLYSVAMLGSRHMLVAGGGGAANTGVRNGWEVLEVVTDGEVVRGESVARHLTGEFSVYSLAVRTGAAQPLSAVLAAGHGGYCQLYRLGLERAGPGGGARQRKPSSPGSRVEEARPLQWKVEPGNKVQIDYSSGEPFGKVVRVSPSGKMLGAGGDDGHLRVFSFPDLARLHDFATHEKEIDDLDFSPDSNRLCSISKDKRAIVWDVKKGKKHAELGWESPAGVKYLFKRVKFACVEGDSKKYKLFTISNPIGSSKVPSYLHRWSSQSYTVEAAVASERGLAYSALAVSDNGNFVATGTMSEGVVDIFTGWNLARVRRVRAAHNTFITGLEFLPTSDEAAPCRAFREASVISISVDHQVCIHHVPELQTVSSLTAFTLVTLVLLAAFLLSSYLGL